MSAVKIENSSYEDEETVEFSQVVNGEPVKGLDISGIQYKNTPDAVYLTLKADEVAPEKLKQVLTELLDWVSTLPTE